MYGFGFDCIGGMGTFGWIGMILNLILIIGLIVASVYFVIWLVRKGSLNGQALASSSYQGDKAHSPREILEISYVRGEITREQYQTMMEDIG